MRRRLEAALAPDRLDADRRQRAASRPRRLQPGAANPISAWPSKARPSPASRGSSASAWSMPRSATCWTSACTLCRSAAAGSRNATDRADRHPRHPRPRRVQGAAGAAGARADDGRAVHLRRPVRPGADGRRARAWTCGRTRTSTSRPSPICSTARSSIATASARDQRIEPGAINLMTAGKGIVHSERSPADDARASGPSFYGMQTWLALPDGKEEIDPGLRACAGGRPAAGRRRRRVGAGADGDACGARRAATTCHSPTIYADIAARCRRAAWRSTPRPTSGRSWSSEGEAELDGAAARAIRALRPGARPSARLLERPARRGRCCWAAGPSRRGATSTGTSSPRRGTGSTRPRKTG